MSDTLRIEAWNWAREEFSHSDLANSQSTQRLVGMATAVAVRPAGCVSKVFTSAADSQGAYDFLENQRFDYQPIQQAACAATLERCEHESFVFVPVDGSAVSVVDRGCCKDIGFIGTRAQRGRGEKVINACAVSSSGTPIGICTQVWWSRTSRSTKRNDVRKVGEKETRHWHTALENVVELYEQSTCRCWFQLDREADSWSLLRYLSSLDHLFTVRGNRDRVVRTSGGRRSKLRTVLSRRKRLGQHHVDVPATAKRSARRACIELRTTKTTLMLRDKKSGRMYPTAVNVVWAHEVGTTPKGEKPLDWVLMTNYAVCTLEQARLVIYGYSQRWRIEDFHRTWKSGVCDVERSQLRTKLALRKWATILASVAMRVEQIKHLARTQPDADASAVFTPTEIQALLLLKDKYAKRTEQITDDMMPTVSQATEWVARLGGYTGKSSGGPPGSITIGRGLTYLRAVADGLEALKNKRKKRRA